MPGRRIMFSKQCDEAAERIGGYQAIDEALTVGIYNSLARNPYGFPSVESDWFSARYIVTKPFGNTPALVWIFTIEPTGDVVLEHVEVFENYR